MVRATNIVESSTERARALYLDGDYGEALVEAEFQIASLEPSERLFGLLLKACIQSEREQYAESLQTLRAIGSLIDDAPAKSKVAFYGQRAFVYAKSGKRDGALVDYEEARFWAHEAVDDLAEARVRNNLAKIYNEVGRYDEAITESESAIHIARRLNDRVHLGRFYDQRAQILNERKHYADALSWSEKALLILGSHPSAAEARTTHGRALIGVGESYLDNRDCVENFRVRREIANSLNINLDAETVQLALRRCGGNMQRAASLLNVQHQSLQGAVKRFHLEAHQGRRVRRSIITK